MPRTVNRDSSDDDLEAAIEEAMNDSVVTAMTAWYAREPEPLCEPTEDDEEAYRERLMANAPILNRKIDEALEMIGKGAEG